MTLTGNKLSPDEGMYLKHKLSNTIFAGDIYIPTTLSEKDFEEITANEYNHLLEESASQKEDDNMTSQEYVELYERLTKVEATSTDNSNQITQVQEALCEIYEQIEE